MSGKEKLSDAQQIEIAQRYAEGESGPKLARDYSCTLTTITKACKRHGVVIRRAGMPGLHIGEGLQDQIERLYAKDGLAYEAVAGNTGVHTETVKKVLAHRNVPLRQRWASGPAHPKWNGGRIFKKSTGYTWLWINKNDPLFVMATNGNYVLEHRYIMAKTLGRALTSTETVHHINGKKSDNRIENLQLRQGKHGNGVVLVCAHCGSKDIRTEQL